MAPAGLKNALNAKLVPFIVFQTRKTLADEVEKMQAEDVVGLEREPG